MPLPDHLQARPRSTGAILDDGWRLVLSDVPLLLSLSGLFFMPAASLVVWMLTQPLPESAWLGLLLPAVATVLLLLTGLAAGASQEAFHLMGEARFPTLGGCLSAALRRGLGHVAAQALVLALPLGALLWLILPDAHVAVRILLALAFLMLSLPIWMLGLTRHTALAAGQRGVWRAWRGSFRISGRYPARAMVLVFVRLALLLFAVLNLHLFARLFFWVAEDLAGFDVAFLRLLCGLDNPAYLIGVVALAWWLLSPYAEAVNYLFFVDARVRHEGLDLWYRVEDFFPVKDQPPPTSVLQPTGQAARVALLALAVLGLLPGSAAADHLETVRQARKELAAIRGEIQSVNPYPGAKRWAKPLQDIGRQLDMEAGKRRGGFDWYRRAIEDFSKLDRQRAVKTLDSIERRLAAIEDSLTRLQEQRTLTPEQIKNLVDPEFRDRKPRSPPPEEKDRKKPEEQEPVQRDRDDPDGPFRGRVGAGPGLVGGASLGGLGQILLILLLGAVAAVLALVIVLVVREWVKNRKPKSAPQQGPATRESDEPMHARPDLQDADALWSEADALARSGDFLAAARALYLAVLGQLHRAGLIRYEPTRTNGEYADQLRRRAELQGPFRRLTGLFELKWYGERSCREVDYHRCRDLAQEVRFAAAPRA